MKNQRIVKAYDSVNPTREQKDRMLRAIMQQADFLEETDSPARKKEPTVYTARPAKTSKRSLIVPIAACLAVLVLSVAVLGQMLRQTEDPAYLAPTETAAPSDNSQDLVLPPDPTPYGMYNAIIADFTGYLNGTIANPTCIPKGLPEVIAQNNALHSLGWVVYDVNRDGVEELLIGDGELIYMAVTMYEEDGGAPILFTSTREEQYYRCQDEIFCRVSDYGNDYVQYDFFKVDMAASGFQELLEVVICEGGAFRIGKTEETAASVDKSTANWTLGEKYLRERLFVTPFLEEAQADEPARNLTGYAPYNEILQRYDKAVDQSWDYTMLEINNMSTMVAEHGVWLDLGWCLLDIDSNGVEELIIAKGERIYDLYTIEAEEIKQVAVSRAGSTYALCQNGYLALTRIQGDDLPWYKSYFKYDNGRLTEGEAISYEEVESAAGNYWQYYRGNSAHIRQPISENEAGVIMSDYYELELFPTRFVPIREDVYDTDGTYAETLQLYRKALTEKWNQAQCSENDISYMLAYFTDRPGEVGYAFLNLNGGEEELIVTDGRNILDLYTVENGKILHVLSGFERKSFTLTDDKKIFCQGASSAAESYYTLFSLPLAGTFDGVTVKVEESYVFDAAADPENPWFFSTGDGSRGESCGSFDAEARTEELMASGQEINFRRFN